MERRSFFAAVAPLALSPVILTEEKTESPKVDLERLRLCALFVNAASARRGALSIEYKTLKMYDRRRLYNRYPECGITLPRLTSE